MIPDFPSFKHLEITDREDVMNYTSKFLPYSDFNFVSMWSWDVEGKIMISQLNGNLVVKFSDYVTGEPFFSFIGNQKLQETLTLLTDHAKKENIAQVFKLIPEDTIKIIQAESIDGKLSIQEDRDSFDYLLSVEKMHGFGGNKLRGKRNFLNRCERGCHPVIEILNLGDEKVKKDLLRVMNDWKAERADRGDVLNDREFDAITKLFHGPFISSLITIGVYIDDSLEGFVVGEKLHDGYAMLHFEKAKNTSRVGIYAYMMHSFAGILNEKGCKWINYEQDLGIPGLRKHKESLLPIYLKKYTITIN